MRRIHEDVAAFGRRRDHLELGATVPSTI